ncbi:MAG TPA: MtnX-like HAD-IB family phosphatase [Anaeromyxobacteraceae bacterium]|nr:MtnX-like HAD-IB family phosphatase [Anaeromyxobacteraceae bacterium]
MIGSAVTKSGQQKERWAIACDFDGTAVTEDVGDAVSIHFAGREHWQAAEDRYRTGELTFRALLSAMFAPVTASRDEVAAFARARAVLRPGLERLLAFCREEEFPFVLCSAGLDVYILPVLERLPPALRTHLGLRCNLAHCSPAGLTVEFLDDGGGCGRCGFCKGTVVDELKARGYRVAMCGDGSADRCAAKKADLVFARGRLPRYCEELGIPYTRFETFDDVLSALKA